jgi:hypothetical protein
MACTAMAANHSAKKLITTKVNVSKRIRHDPAL